MPTIDYSTREVGLRFAIVGALGSGRRTVLQKLHATLPPSERTEITDHPFGQDRLMSFDFAPGELLPTAEYRARATLFVFTGAPLNDPVCGRALADVDALLFVADSRRARLEENLDALRQLGTFRFLHEVPVVFFYNHRDAAETVAIGELEAFLNPLHAPHRAGAATTGAGLDGTLAELTRATLSLSP
jgi:hypothetical protein